MSLLGAHKILIASAVVLFAGYALWELRNYAGGDATAPARGVLAGIAAVDLAVYLRWVWTRRADAPPRR